MENKEMCCGCTAPMIHHFLNKNDALFHGMYIKSALYIADDGYYESIYVIQKENGNCFIFELSCGILEHIKEERNAIEKYMMRIPTANYAEYIKFD